MLEKNGAVREPLSEMEKTMPAGITRDILDLLERLVECPECRGRRWVQYAVWPELEWREDGTSSDALAIDPISRWELCRTCQGLGVNPNIISGV